MRMAYISSILDNGTRESTSWALELDLTTAGNKLFNAW